MRRLLLVLALAAGLAVSSLAAPRAAQASGCQAFGQTAAAESQIERPLGQVISGAAPANDDVALLQQELCG
jgi:hypothetical protein